MSRADFLTGLFGLAGRIAVVTGACPGGLGEHAARALAEAGARVALVDLPATEPALRGLVVELRPVPGGHCVATCDVTDEAAVAHAFAAIAEELGGVDILVHVAGVMLRRPALETDVADWRRVVDVNLTGTLLANRSAARHMLARGGGRIVNVSSVYTQIVGALPESAYYASKGGVAQLTRGLAAEWGRDGINVNCVAPGVFFPTRMTQPLADTPEVLAKMQARTLLGRLGDPPRDLAGVLLFLCAPASGYLTGQVIFVDGGWSAW